jgi:hypothetical protein
MKNQPDGARVRQQTGGILFSCFLFLSFCDGDEAQKAREYTPRSARRLMCRREENNIEIPRE